MSSTTISNVKSKTLIFGNLGNNLKTQDVQGKESFSDVFEKTQNPVEIEKQEVSAKTEDNESIQDHAKMQTNKASEQLKEKSKEVETAKGEKEMEEAVQKAAEEMVGKVAETFEVTVEEVEAVLETLGLNVMDLLNPENLTQVVLALNPECDALTLMTNEELYADLKALMDMAQEWKGQIALEFQLSEEEMTQVLNTVKEQLVSQAPVEMDVMETVNAQENDTVEEKQKVNFQQTEVTEAETSVYDGTVIPKTENTQELRSNSSKTGEQTGNEHAGAQSFQQNFVEQLAEAVENASSETTSYGVRGQDIINQITEQIRVHVKQDTTEMELQLHPASLGSVKVQLTSAGGVLTAVFTTENETVKAALESQLIQLKENFAQQGLKVESVEVNVSAQGFERSLDEQEQEQRRFEENRSRKGNRRIRLNGMGEAEELLGEEMTADDRIVADMMIRNGNTVDYTV